MEKLEQKKSAVDLTELAIGIVVLGIVVSIGAVILNNVGSTQITNTATYKVTGEAFTITTAGTPLTTSWVKSVDAVYNTTAGVTLAPGNYTVSIDSGNGIATIANKTTCVFGGDPKMCAGGLSANYTVYNTSDPRYAIPSKATLGLLEYGNWFKILVIVGISAVVLALIFMAFGKGNEASEGGSVY